MKKRIARLVVVPASVLALFLVPAAAFGRVIPNACIAGIGLWDSKERVAREWGLPVRMRAVGPDVVWDYPKGSVFLYRWHRAPTPNRWIVLGITTTDPRERLHGIGVGSWRSEVHAASVYGCPARAEFCTLVASRGESRTTDVRLKGNRVVSLSVSLSSDFDDGGQLQYADRRCRNSKS